MLRIRFRDGPEYYFPSHSAFRKVRVGSDRALDTLVVWEPGNHSPSLILDTTPYMADKGLDGHKMVSEVKDDEVDYGTEAWHRLEPIVIPDDEDRWPNIESVLDIPLRFMGGIISPTDVPISIPPDREMPFGTQWRSRSEATAPGGADQASVTAEQNRAEVQTELRRIETTTGRGENTPLVQDAQLRQLAIDQVTRVKETLADFEGRGIERQLIDEIVLPELDYLLDALNLESYVLEELISARQRVARARTILERAKRAFEKAGEWTIAGVIGNAVYELARSVPTW